MSVRYTAVASMDGPALEDVDRNVERWREKIEVKLDNRQVFFLFFGSAVVACMLFVLGVMVGKRIESRGQADAAPVLQDPLAALDRAHQPPPGVAAPDPQLTFPSTLGGGSPKLKGTGAHASALSSLPKVVAAQGRRAEAGRRGQAGRPASRPRAKRPRRRSRLPPPSRPQPSPRRPTRPRPRESTRCRSAPSRPSGDADAFVQKYPGAFVIAATSPARE